MKVLVKTLDKKAKEVTYNGYSFLLLKTKGGYNLNKQNDLRTDFFKTQKEAIEFIEQRFK